VLNPEREEHTAREATFSERVRGMRGSRSLSGAVAVLACALGAWVPSAHAAEGLPGLEFVEPNSVKLSPSDAETATKPVSVWLQNTSAKALEPAFKVYAEDDDGKPVEGLTVAAEKGSVLEPVPGGDVRRYRILVRNIKKSQSLSGQLVATANAGTDAAAAPAAVDLELSPKQTGPGSDVIFLVAGLIAFVLVLFRWGTMRFARAGDTLAPADLEFSSGVASTLTVVGAVLGTAVAADVLPEHTQHLSKPAYTALNVIFGVLIAVGALAFGAFQKQTQGEKGPELHGYVAAFMLATFLTAWAALGELWTLWYLVSDVDASTGFTEVGTTTIKVLLAISAIGVLIYLAVRMHQVAEPAAPAGVGGEDEGTRATRGAQAVPMQLLQARRMPRLPV
jgi:hypothetical protein